MNLHSWSPSRAIPTIGTADQMASMVPTPPKWVMKSLQMLSGESFNQKSFAIPRYLVLLCARSAYWGIVSQHITFLGILRLEHTAAGSFATILCRAGVYNDITRSIHITYK